MGRRRSYDRPCPDEGQLPIPFAVPETLWKPPALPQLRMANWIGVFTLWHSSKASRRSCPTTLVLLLKHSFTTPASFQKVLRVKDMRPRIFYWKRRKFVASGFASR
jgi:hypothetical protein